MDFKCAECDAVSPSFLWDEVTVNEYGMNGDDSEVKAISNNKRTLEDFAFVCPVCGHTDARPIWISKEEK